jgi:hypothetical protein
MILTWKAVAMDRFQAEWQGMTLLVERGAALRHAWHLTLTATAPGAVLEVNGEPAWASKRRWPSARLAMEAADRTAERIVMRKARAQGGVPVNRAAQTKGRPIFTREALHA